MFQAIARLYDILTTLIDGKVRKVANDSNYANTVFQIPSHLEYLVLLATRSIPNGRIPDLFLDKGADEVKLTSYMFYFVFLTYYLFIS